MIFEIFEFLPRNDSVMPPNLLNRLHLDLVVLWHFEQMGDHLYSIGAVFKLLSEIHH